MLIKKNIAILGLGSQQILPIKNLRKKYNIIGFDGDKDCPGKEYVKNFYNFDLKDKKKIIKICKKKKIIFATTFCNEHFIQLSYDINHHIGFDKTNSKILKLIRNKYLCKKKIIKINQNIIPNFKKLHKGKINVSKKFIPGVLKPVYGSGSKGVFFVKNINEIVNLNLKSNNLYKNGILIEKYVPGTEYAIDGWVYERKFKFCCLSKKKTSRKPNLIDLFLIINYFNNSIINKGKHLANELINIFDLNNVPIHVEFKIKKNKPVLIDFSIRGPGFGVYTYIMSKIISADSSKIQVDLLNGKKINFKKPLKKKFLLYFLYSQPGKIFKIEGLNLIRNKIKNSKIEMFKKIGDTSKGYESGVDRVGKIIVEENDTNVIQKRIKYIKKNVKIYAK